MGSNATRRKFRDWKPVDKDGKSKDVQKGKTVRQYEDEFEEEEFMPAKKGTRGRGRGAGTASGAGRRRIQG